MSEENAMRALLGTKMSKNRGNFANSYRHSNRERAQVAMTQACEHKKDRVKHSAIRMPKKLQVAENCTQNAAKMQK